MKKNYVIICYDKKYNMYFVKSEPKIDFKSILEFSVLVNDDIYINDILDNIKIFSSRKNAEQTSKSIINTLKQDNISTEIYSLSSFVKTLNKYKCQCSKNCDRIIPFKNGGCYNLPDIGLVKPICFDKISLKIGSTSPFTIIDYIKKNKSVEH